MRKNRRVGTDTFKISFKKLHICRLSRVDIGLKRFCSPWKNISSIAITQATGHRSYAQVIPAAKLALATNLGRKCFAFENLLCSPFYASNFFLLIELELSL